MSFVQRVIGLAVGGAFREINELGFAGPRTAFQQHIADLRNRRAGGNVRESALAQDRGFERELRREPGAHLLLGARRPGFVIEDDVAAVGAALDAVGDAAQPEGAVGERNIDLAANFGGDRR